MASKKNCPKNPVASRCSTREEKYLREEKNACFFERLLQKPLTGSRGDKHRCKEGVIPQEKKKRFS